MPRYLLLEKFRLVGSVLVIALHTQLLSDIFPEGFLLPNGFARLAVPYFALLSGYFTGTRAVDEGPAAPRKWMTSVLRTYLFLFPLYAPFYVQSLIVAAKAPGASVGSIVVRALDEIVFTGYAYHLWYLPGVVYALLAATFFMRRFPGVWAAAIVASAVYIAGSLATTWNWILPGHPFGSSAGAADRVSWLRFLYLLAPFVMGGALVRRIGERFSERAAWAGLIVGTLGLVVETNVVEAHAGVPEAMLSLPIVGICGFRILLARIAPHKPGTWPYAQVSNLVYCFHLFPLLMVATLTRRQPPSSVVLFLTVSAATALMVFITLRTRLAKVFV